MKLLFSSGAVVMMSSMVLQLFGLAFVASVLHAKHEFSTHLVTSPHVPVVEIGTNFTATCVIVNTVEVTADSLYWNLSESSVVPEKNYIKINESALAVTILISGEESEWLFCSCKKNSPYVSLNKSKFIHGIYLKKAYPPRRVENLSCVAEQDGKLVSGFLNCKWDAVGGQTEDVKTNYTVMVQHESGTYRSKTTFLNKTMVDLGFFPHFMHFDVWVVADNLLGTVESEHLKQDANEFVKTDPPSKVTAFPEELFPNCLLIKWEHPIEDVRIKLTYQIRYCESGSHTWSYIPLGDTDKVITSFRLQNLQPNSAYVIQMRCRNREGNSGPWSNWSANETKTTPEDRPRSKPDLWQLSGGDHGEEVQIICKDPKHANGRITSFGLILYNKNGPLEQEIIPADQNQNSSESRVTVLKKISLADKQFVRVCVNANNSKGTSPEACLILVRSSEKTTVEKLKVWTQEGQMFVEWKRPNNTAVSEYVVEWARHGKTDWQRENKTTTRTAIKGSLEKFVRYNVSVYVIQSGRVWKLVHKEAYLEQGAPEQGPTINKSYPAYDNAHLVWDEIPLDKRRGFITNYNISYRKENEAPKSIRVAANNTSYTLTELLGNTKYEVWISASTVAGSKSSNPHSFTTLRYAPGTIEGIVVGVSLGFLFFVLMALLLCFLKKDVLKENFWPQIPNPGESTIGNWSPDYPPKEETPKENCVSGVSVLDVGVCEVKLGFEEDKTSLSLKKGKYLSEEHSSGIGGSSCMSSPRQSVSDSDEGPDLADSTASTVQYSSVVASSGYKGQTPSSHSQHSIFSRSESTQPLLDSEEHPDVSLQEGCRQVQPPPRPSLFTGAENQNSMESDDFRLLGVEQHDFCPLREDTELTTEPDSLSADTESGAVSSYMPQLGGYRPQ
ncbi:interleukin-6 receptor subunit beta isoform X1 [Poecilia formosa]|uniref:Interleukin-6 receptor subunit beta n=1 Tax=Poecilia formosa TaxID=48698 RepID=A0A087XCC7_POEFO|nr:PREDICTED: interleukin-6 receptor subunit beta isoform X1 [Poecilia formosa]